MTNQNTILNKWENAARECISVKCDKGFEVAGAVDHRVLTLDSDANLVYKELQSLTLDSHIAIRKGFNYFGNDDSIDVSCIDTKFIGDITLPTEMTPDLAYLMGLLCGDGYIESDATKRKFWTVGYCSADPELINEYKRILVEQFNIDASRVHESVRGKLYRIDINSTVLCQYLKSLGMSNKRAPDKIIPDVIKKSSKYNIRAFLSGLFDTDGGCDIAQSKTAKACTVHLVSTSKCLCKEVQSVLLNIGVISTFSVKDKKHTTFFKTTGREHDCVECYRLRITGTDNLALFNQDIGFRLSRKQAALCTYLDNLTKEDFNNTIPYSFQVVRKLAEECKVIGGDNSITTWCLNKYKKYKQTPFSYTKIEELLKYAESLDIKTEGYSKLKKIITNKLYFVSPIEFNTFTAETIDIEVENEHCYWANGFINHNSKMIFSEVEKLYDQSYIFREACAKHPTRGTDSCFLKFKSVGGRPGSYIESLPLGDGNKIRGSRFYLILVDELAQVPDTVLDMVLRPMGATSLAPMERVRRIEEQKRLIESGFADKSDFDEEKVNKMIMTSSGYFKFNHMWRRMRDYWRMMDQAKLEKKECPYSVWQVPYWDLPEGFLDINNIAEAKRIMSLSEYSMEYEAQMISDSEGFFKASLLEECTRISDFEMVFQGSTTGNYVVGVDPNQGGKASCGMVVIEMGKPNKIVNVLELKKETTQGLTKALQELCSAYNVIRIFMDKGGGGKAICDLLEDGHHNQEPIIDRTNPDHEHLEGRHILELVNFNPVWISDANFTTKAMLEDKSLLFPIPPLSTLSDVIAGSYKVIEVLKSQMLSIIVSQTPSGALHFDTPSKHMNKDLYSALILAAHGVRSVEKELEEDTDPILFGHGGMMRPRTSPGFSQASFNFVGGGHLTANPSPAYSLMGLHNAVLKVKKK